MPFGENPSTSRRALYTLEDPFFAYWYAFVSKGVGAIEAGAGSAAARGSAFGQALQAYVGRQFEAVCGQWVVRANAKGELPFLASSFGRWWGTYSRDKTETDIDLIAADKESKAILLGECKWRNSFNGLRAVEMLELRAPLVKGYSRRSFFLFTKELVSEATQEKAKARDDLTLVTAGEMLEAR